MAARTALITGVLGQDGSLLAELLLARGYRVVGIARPGSALPTEGPLVDLKFAEVDLVDSIAVRQLLEQWQPHELYHLAAFHHSSEERPISATLAGKMGMLSTNFLSTKTLAFALVELRSTCHLVFASSSQIYTATDIEKRIDERSLRQPATFYGHTKSWSMDLLALLRDESDLQVSSAILFNHESSRRSPQFVSRKITRAAAQARRGLQPILALGNIGAKVDWSSAHDAVSALARMGGSAISRDYVVASGSLRSVRDLLQAAFASADLDWAEFATFEEDRPVPALVGDASALEQDMGWQREISFEEMISQMVADDLEVS